MNVYTKKNLNKFADQYFTVIHINSNGSRGLQYGGLRGMKLVEVLFKAAMNGTRVVIIECDKVYNVHRDVYGGVQNNSQTDTEFYDKFLPYSYDIKQFFK